MKTCTRCDEPLPKEQPDGQPECPFCAGMDLNGNRMGVEGLILRELRWIRKDLAFLLAPQVVTEALSAEIKTQAPQGAKKTKKAQRNPDPAI